MTLKSKDLVEAAIASMVLSNDVEGLEFYASDADGDIGMMGAIPFDPEFAKTLTDGELARMAAVAAGRDLVRLAIESDTESDVDAQFDGLKKAGPVLVGVYVRSAKFVDSVFRLALGLTITRSPAADDMSDEDRRAMGDRLRAFGRTAAV